MTEAASVHADRPVHVSSRDGRAVAVKRYVNGGALGIYTWIATAALLKHCDCFPV